MGKKGGRSQLDRYIYIYFHLEMEIILSIVTRDLM